MGRQILIVGNWKMNGTINETLKRLAEIRRRFSETPRCEVVVAPPFTSLYSASVALQESSLKLAGQDLHWESEGPYTGEVSGTFLKEAGCRYVIIGHSERRRLCREDDVMINKKVRAALSADLRPILCIGESSEEREAGETFERLENQLKKDLKELHVHDLEGFNIAYEPIWAIGTGNTASVGQINEVHDWIRNYMAKNFDAPSANEMHLLYGGSVTKNNAAEILQGPNVDGLLIGGASLDPEDFVKIVGLASEKE